ncbi:MAG TPA: hypothetical protein VIM61_09060 [Chthoniobacterales bacterium]
MNVRLPGIAALFLGTISAAFAQSEMSNTALARATSDPTSDLWALFTDAEFSTTPAPPFAQANRFTLEFQPTLPVTLTRSWRVLNFPELVLNSEGTPSGAQITGITSFSYLAALSPVHREFGFTWALGPYASLPAATDTRLAPSQWQFGGGGVLGWRAPTFLTAAIIKSGWTTSGPGDPAGSLQIQYTAQYFFGDGAQVGIGRPVVEYNWKRNGSGGWTIPVGLDVARIVHLGSLPVKVMLEYDFTALNDNRWEPAHTFRITFVPVLSSPFHEPVLE